jgi:protein transport protein SEC61 subunit gamma-like protein
MQLVDPLKRFFLECRRVWQVTRKPTKQEFSATVKVTGIGILLIGLVGFLIHLLWQLLLA